MEIRLTGGRNVHLALFQAGFKNITATDNGYLVWVYTVAQLQKVAEVALAVGAISR